MKFWIGLFAIYAVVIGTVLAWTNSQQALNGIDVKGVVVDIVKYNGVEHCVVELPEDERVLTEKVCLTSVGTKVFVQKQNGQNYYQITGVR